ncbi:hypothetical protein POM88_000213 [Heracleum sosnowskyi]|uniref:Uncharacterized protein n=1 Tax=Heracleum sosnowskyi TaxID=360622 RepID=A0AAD8NAN6_9APIA|nr:hypothetical protein POM88_000213 [Heracleum sosnowskyi]
MSGSAAAKLLQSSGLSFSSPAPKEHIGDGKGTGSNSEDDEDGCSTKSCPNSLVPVQNNNLHWNSNVRSSNKGCRGKAFLSWNQNIRFVRYCEEETNLKIKETATFRQFHLKENYNGR